MSGKLARAKVAFQFKTDKYDGLLKIYLEGATNALKLLLSINEGLPQSLEHIVYIVTVKKFNRLKDGGMTFYSQDGESMAFNSNDFDGFRDKIEHYRQDNNIPDQGIWVNPYEV